MQLTFSRRAATVGLLALGVFGASCGRKPLTSRPDSSGDAADSDAVADARDAASDPGAEVTCSKELRSEQERQARVAAAAAAPCFSGSVSLRNGKVGVASESSGRYLARVCSDTRQAQWASQVAETVAGLDASCLCYSESLNAICLPLAVSGGAGTQIQQLSDLLAACGGPAELGQLFQITLDDEGHVVETTGISVDASTCLLRDVQGLTFPCLAGAGICGSEGIRLE